MATCSQVPMILSLSSSSSSSSSSNKKKNRWRSNNISRGSSKIKCSAKIPMPPLNPNDPFLKRVANAHAISPEKLQDSVQSDFLPFANLFGPSMAASPGFADSGRSHYAFKKKRPPPDLPSILLDARVVYIGMPLVSAVTELVVSQLLYLGWDDPKTPIHVYINSSGTTREDGEIVGLETEGFAIYDAMMSVKNEIHTLGLGTSSGQACLLLAAGDKGKRYMFPSAQATIQSPCVPPTGLVQASDLIIRANEASINKMMYAELLAKHTGQSLETILEKIEYAYHMDPEMAKEFGVIDKVLYRGQKKVMQDMPSADGLDKKAGVKNRDGM